MNLNAYKQHLNSIGILSIFSIIIWFFGPHLSSLLEQGTQRFYAIALLFLIWLLKIIFFDAEPAAVDLSDDPEVTKKIHGLQNRFDGALQFLKSTIINKHGKNIRLEQLPWYLLIGPSKSGKTSLLTNANLNFILSKQTKLSSLTPSTENCDWWVTRDHTILDVPGKYLESQSILWQALLSLISQKRKKNTIKGIILALPLPELMQQTDVAKLNATCQALLQRLAEIEQSFGMSLPVHIVITKCDQLAGFNEFFKDCTTDELAQSWGVSLPTLKADEKIEHIFLHRFNLLIKRLNKQLIWRLHQERNAAYRPLIKDFPLQIEKLKRVIAKLIKTLAAGQSDIIFQGVYLTSAVQTEKQKEPTNAALKLTNSQTQTAIQAFKAPELTSRSYFIKQLLSYTLPNLHHAAHLSYRHNKTQKYVYLTAGTLIISSAIIFGKDFTDNLQQARAIRTNLAEYQNILQIDNPSARLIKSISVLDALQSASALADNHNYILPRFFSIYSQRLAQTGNAAYQQGLQTIVLSGLKSSFEEYLQSGNKNTGQTYGVLKAYLMLAYPERKQDEFIIHTFQEVFIKDTDLAAKENFNQHIQAALSLKQSQIKPDLELITQVRKNLNDLPSQELAYIILKNIRDNNLFAKVNLGTNIGSPPALTSPSVDNTIPRMFTAKAFPSVLSKEIPLATQEALQGNWILGEDFSNGKNSAIADTLTTQLQTTYVNHYVDIWETLLANIQLSKPQNLVQTNAMIANLVSDTSPLLQLLQTIQGNTRFATIMSTSPKLQGLNSLLTNSKTTQNNSLYHIFIALRSLHAYLETIVTARHQDEAAFNAVNQRARLELKHDPFIELQTMAATAPEPLRDWLNSVANNAWGFLLQEAANYVNTEWQNKVITQYQNNIAHRYPFSDQAKAEVNLQQFVNFFGEPGILSQFYYQYLYTFIDRSDKKWQWRTIDNQHLPLSNAVLEQIQHALLIQKTFFPNNDNKLNVLFTLQPLATDKAVKNFKLSMNGQSIEYDNDAPAIPHSLSWPGNNAKQSTTISWTIDNKKITPQTINGDWSWFKVVEQNTHKVLDKRKLLLTFAADEHKTKYLLFTQGQVNPFVPMNLQHFNLPAELKEEKTQG